MISSTSGPRDEHCGVGVDSPGSRGPSLLDAGKPWEDSGEEAPIRQQPCFLRCLSCCRRPSFPRAFSARALSEGDIVEKGASSDAPAGACSMDGCDGPSEAFRHPRPQLFKGEGGLVKSPWLQQTYLPSRRMQHQTGIQKDAVPPS